MRQDTDKKGSPCHVCDCIINDQCMQWIAKDLQLREILIEWCLEAVELREAVTVDRDAVKLPKLTCKGSLPLPVLEIPKRELERDFKRDIASIIEENTVDEPVKVLQLKRTQNDDPDDTLPPLFPQSGNVQGPLIEEIDVDMDDLKITKQEPTSSRTSPLLKDLHFETVMRKTNNTQRYKLRIDITSEIDSSLDLHLAYDRTNNELILQNLNTVEFIEKKIKIPLPNIFTYENIKQSECFFIKKQKRLIIFI